MTESRDGGRNRQGSTRARHLSDQTRGQATGKTKREKKGNLLLLLPSSGCRFPPCSCSSSSQQDATSSRVSSSSSSNHLAPTSELHGRPGDRDVLAKQDLLDCTTYPTQTGSMGDSKNEPAGDGLPDGWSKEYRPRKTRPGARVRRDMFYIDPTNSHEFRSLKDVYRYLESRDTSNSAVTPNKRKVEDLRISGNLSHHAEGPSDNIQINTAHESNRKSRENSENMASSEPEGVSQRRLTELELQKAGVNNQSRKHQSDGREEANVEPKPKEKKQKTKPAKQISTPLRASPRLTALKLSQEASNVPRDSPTQTDVADQLQPTKQVKNSKSKPMSSLLPQKKDGAHSASASGHAEHKYPSAPEQTLGTSVAYSITDVGYQNEPARVHAPPQQAGIFETPDAMPGSSLSSLLRSIWSDPCLEFAFKTLTGDIPVLDNNLAAPNYFLPPQDLNKGTGPNCSSSTYDGARKNHVQVDCVRMPRPSDKLYSGGWFPPQ